MLIQIWQRWRDGKAAAEQVETLCTAMIRADQQGMTLLGADGGEVRVDFAAAARAYHAASRQSSRKCVGDRDVMAKRFVFPGEGRTLLQVRTLDQFNQVRTAIQQAGYTTFDLT